MQVDDVSIRIEALHAATQTASAMAAGGRAAGGTFAEYVLVTAKAYESYLRTGDIGLSAE